MNIASRDDNGGSAVLHDGYGSMVDTATGGTAPAESQGKAHAWGAEIAQRIVSDGGGAAADLARLADAGDLSEQRAAQTAHPPPAPQGQAPEVMRHFDEPSAAFRRECAIEAADGIHERRKQEHRHSEAALTDLIVWLASNSRAEATWTQ